MNWSPTQFPDLFKKYRLLSQISSLAALVDLLSEEGLNYDPSILSHWQRGKRAPSDRNVLLALIKIFVKNGGMRSLDEANEFLSSSEQGYLTDQEILDIPQLGQSATIFQVPRDISAFIGRESYLEQMANSLTGKIFLLHGLSGCGKTALAIHLAHEYKHLFPDGVVWLRLDALTVLEAINYIGGIFGEDLTQIKDIHTKAATLRSLILNKRVLLILDNVEKTDQIELLFPNGNYPTVVVTSVKLESSLLDKIDYCIQVEPFTQDECLKLFEAHLGRAYVDVNHKELQRISALVGFLPLIINLSAVQLKNHYFTSTELLNYIKTQAIPIKEYKYKDSNLLKSLDLSFSKLDKKMQGIFLSLSLFLSESFGIEPLVFIHNEPNLKIKEYLEELVRYNLLEHATHSRYRVHPLVNQYINQRLGEKKKLLLTQVSEYYSNFLEKTANTSRSKEEITPEFNIIIVIVKECIKLGLYDEVVQIWLPLSIFLRDTGRWQVADQLGDEIIQICKDTGNISSAALLLIREKSWLHYWRGNFEQAKAALLEGSKLASLTGDSYLMSFAKQRLGILTLKEGQLDRSEQLLLEALSSFSKLQRLDHVSDVNLYLGHVFKKQKKLSQSLKHYEIASNIAKNIEDRKAEGIAYYYLGELHSEMRKLDEAMNFFNLSMQIDEQIGHKPGVPFNLIGMAKVSLARDDREEAEKLLTAAREACIKIEMLEPINEIDTLSQRVHG